MTTKEIIMESDFTMEERLDSVATNLGKIKLIILRKEQELLKSHMTRKTMMSLISSLGSEKMMVLLTNKMCLLKKLIRQNPYRHIAIEEMLPHSLLMNFEHLS